MPHTSKKRSSVGVGNNLVHPPPARRSRRIAGRLNADFDDLDDVLANVLEFLPINKIMCNRRVSKKWGEAIKKAVPHGDIRVTNMDNYIAVRERMRAKGIVFLGQNNSISHVTMRVMTTAMPNLQEISLGSYGTEHKYSDGEDPDEEHAARTADYTTLDIEIISNFRKLRILTINDDNYCSILNGRYPFLFNSFPLLQKFSITGCKYLKWDLEMLSAFPLLKELDVFRNNQLTGNIRSLRAQKDTLETLAIASCANVEGNLMDLADFPQLKELNLYNTAVRGDVRDIGENDFTNLERLNCPSGVVGGSEYKFQHVADVPSVVNAYCRLKRRAKYLGEIEYMHFTWELSDQSPDYYEAGTESQTIVYAFEYRDFVLPPPLCISFVKAGSRVGWRWVTWPSRDAEYPTHSCEINWLDPEPDREDDDYEAYVKELASIQWEINVYRGYRQRPRRRNTDGCAENMLLECIDSILL